ncbi:(2Fe-2S)-binding protein [Nakamurella sp. YIM 132087]|uniref:(2Fe-2S)-binding protein n=1 Tax=Nakamurella alba TaxID=2665158 RepID=A0A7K1FH26_9ACTN|nr:(2Fe-2S)-binding protein [Nakamurella alba]MTD12769.1 (2Fe-2S)-binding protein [Nakamurella alba]
MNQISAEINGRVRSCAPLGAESLLHSLRERWELRGAKEGCLEGECGACTVLLDGRAVDSCLVPTAAVDGRSVRTIEGLAGSPVGTALQGAFQAHGAVQCGFCTPGMIVSLTDLLEHNPDPDRGQVLDAVTGNICRCTGYVQIVEAALAAAATLRGETS